MILEDFALNIAAGLAQWLIEPQLDDWRRRLHDPQRDAITKVFESAARQMLRILTSDLQYARPDLGPGDYEVLGEVLEDFFALEPVRVAVLDAAITGRPLDQERMRTRFGTIRGSDPGIVVPLERCLTQFCTHLGSGIYSAAQDMDSPVHNFWSVLVAGNMQRLAWGIANTVQETQSGIAELRRLLMQALEQSSAPPAPLWVNVPPQPNLILGRGDLLTELVNRLIAGDNPALSADGLPGVGKTTLAVLLAYDARVREHFRDGVLWAGLGRQADVATVQATWAEALGVDLGDLGDLGQRQERISRALAGRRVLVVLDDAWDAAVADGLRCSGPYVRHVLTTRDEGIARSFAGAAQVFKVPVFDGDTAWTFLQKLAPEMCAAEPVAARALADSVGGLPLAVELLGGYLAAPQRSQFAGQRKRALVAVATPAERLALATRRLGDKAGVLQTLEAVIRLSVDDLAESAPEAASAFWALGAFAPKPATFALAAALAVTGANEDVLALLAERNLIEVGAGDWLAVHQVVHDVMATETPEEAAAAQARHYAQAMSAANDEQRYHVMLPALPQLRFAFAWAIEQDLDLALDIAISSAQLQKQFNLVREGGDWSERLLEAVWSRDVASETLARAFGHRAGVLCAIATLPGEDRGKRLLEALAAYDDALQYRRSDVAPLAYALTQSNRGSVLSEIATLSGEDRGKRLLEALAACDDALQYRRSDAAPLAYAATQHNRANLLSEIATLPGEDRGKRLLEALAAYDDALQYRRSEVVPLDYAMTQSNRGLLLSAIATLPGEERRERLLQALDACDDSLKYRKPELAPLDYADNQINRGLVLSEIASLPGEDRGERLLEALAAYNDALQYRSPEVAPLDYATVQNNRGIALRAIATLPDENRRDRLLQALAACDDALQYRRSEVVPQYYAATQNNRGVVLSELATLPGEERRGRLMEALAACDDALQYISPKVVPLDYAGTQNNRANWLSEIASLPGEDRGKRLLEALASYDDALQYRRSEVAPLAYAMTQYNRGLVLSEIASLPGEDRGERLLESLAAYDDALQYRRSEVVPLDCATTQYNRGLLLSAIATLPGEDRRKRLLQALAAYDDALQYYRPEIAPLVYAMAQGNLANLYMLLSELAGEDRRSRQLQSVQSAVLALGFFEQVGHDVYVVQARKQIAYLRRRFGVDVFSSLWSELWSELGFGDLPAWLADDPSE